MSFFIYLSQLLSLLYQKNCQPFLTLTLETNRAIIELPLQLERSDEILYQKRFHQDQLLTSTSLLLHDFLTVSHYPTNLAMVWI